MVGSRCPPVGAIACPCGHHPRALDPAQVDRLLQRDVQQHSPGLHEQAEVANGGVAAAQGAAGVGGGPQGPYGRVLLDRDQRAAVVRTAEEEVDLHVHQARQQGDVPEVADHRALGQPGGLDLGDVLAHHQYLTRLDDLPLVHIQQACRPQQNGRLRRLLPAGRPAFPGGHHTAGSMTASMLDGPLSGTLG
jgi:hypothetical protein